MDIFTIGHSNIKAEVIVDLLKQHSIEVLIDVRSVPYSRFNPQFNRESFKRTLNNNGIQYAYAGHSLGGRPNDPTCYDGDQVQYSRIMDKPWYLQGIDQLLECAKYQRVALMCSEEDPKKCHRHNLIAQTLMERGVTVWHIRGDGRLEEARPNQPEAQQLHLF